MNKRIIVISGFSGAGKGTLVRQLLELDRNALVSSKLWLSVSDTTRPPHNDGGGNYNFICAEEYNDRIANGFYLEHNEYGNHGYGTPIKPVLVALEHGNTVCWRLIITAWCRCEIISVTAMFLLQPFLYALKAMSYSIDCVSEAIHQTKSKNDCLPPARKQVMLVNMTA